MVGCDNPGCCKYEWFHLQCSKYSPAKIYRYTVVRGTDSYLAIENRVHCQVAPENIILALMAAFYAFNMHYPLGCYNYFHEESSSNENKLSLDGLLAKVNELMCLTQ